ETPCRSGLDDHRIADAHLIEVPGGVGRTEVDTAVADVRVALGSDRPRRGVDVHPTPGDANRVFDVESVTLGVIEWDADGAGIHHDHLLFPEHAERPCGGGEFGFTHRGGHFPDH